MKITEKETSLEKIMLCFALDRNHKFLVSNEIGGNSVQTIHGLRYFINKLRCFDFKQNFHRTLGMIWIMAGHIFCYAYGTIDNMQIIFAKAHKWAFQPVLSTAMSVDTFFVLRFAFDGNKLIGTLTHKKLFYQYF